MMYMTHDTVPILYLAVLPPSNNSISLYFKSSPRCHCLEVKFQWAMFGNIAIDMWNSR